jgi:flagellar basal body-associated protein FliL
LVSHLNKNKTSKGETMKKEKGSALLTVILIAAVTATIGAAVSSFILMNYRLQHPSR